MVLFSIDGVDAATYGVTGLRDLKIKPAAITVYSDWTRQGLNPLRYGSKATYKSITFTIRIEGPDDDTIQHDISNLSSALTSCKLQFVDNSYLYDAELLDADPTYITDGVYELDVSMQSSYAYLPSVAVSLASASQPVTAQGNLPSPAVVTLTPAQDVGAVTLTGLSKVPIKVSNLHAGAPVTIDGEACTVTEPDLDKVMTTAMGSGKWMLRKYSAPNLMSPDTADPEIAPTFDTIPADSAYTQQLISDAANLYHNKGGYDYIGHLKTGVYVASTKTVTLQMYHDDGATVYLNNAAVYSCAHVMAPDAPQTAWQTHASVTLSLVAGWNRIDIIWIQHYGGDGIWDISPTFSSAADQLSAYYARDASPTGTVNKFPDTDFWQFPALQPGTQTVATDTPLATCGVAISYKPKSM